MRKISIALALVALGLVGCGDDVTTVTEVTQVVGMKVVEEGEALPKCNTENEGAMVYSVDSAAAFYCINRKWTSMKGADGVDGKDGKNGKDGKDGENGADGEDGADGKNGKDGKNGADGKNCEIVSDTNGVTTLKCGEDTTTLYKAICGIKPYDPAKQFCDTRDNQLYKYVTIAPEGTDYSEVWMAENLNYKVDSSWCYNDSAEYCEKYGRLYTWAAAIDSAGLYKDKSIDCGYYKECRFSGRVRGVCPEGWHLPARTEWISLLIAVGGEEKAGRILKSQTGWNDDGNGTDAYGFSALPAFDDSAIFWSATERGYEHAYDMILRNNDDSVEMYVVFMKFRRFSVRCLKDTN